ncbi:hypothetical protein [Actinomadura violacea]|uniref:Peptidase M23 domain-containing protein n=1 Tax=Actinomadura violacea TaxID=2819934 RepID=A0ABS3RZC9_9ACTN|nr:hypothetical protein [Actinomadura violacea]MBO2461823.1 hypothetical protein [Actinomadura violacea]
MARRDDGHASRINTHAAPWARAPERPSPRAGAARGRRPEEPQWPEGSWWSEQPGWDERDRRRRREPTRRDVRRREKDRTRRRQRARRSAYRTEPPPAARRREPARGSGRRPPTRPRPGPKATPRRPRLPTDRIGVGALVLSAVVGLSLLGIAERTLLDGRPIGTTESVAAGKGLRHPKGRATAAPGSPHRPAQRPGASGAPAAPARPDAQALTAQVRKATLAQRGAAARQAYGAAPTRAPIVAVARTSDDGTWMFGTTAIPVPASSDADPEIAFFAARWTGREWRIGLSGATAFGTLLGAMPATLMSASEARALRRYSTLSAGHAAAAVNGTGPGDGLMLPWKTGTSWTMLTAGPASAQRPLSALAFAGGDGRVLASGAGRLYRFCGDGSGPALLMVVHAGGVATTYDRVRSAAQLRDGSVVGRGDPLGRTGTAGACGGAPADRAEVRFDLRRGAAPVPLDGAVIGGWTFSERAKPLLGFAERGLLQVLPGGLIANLGAVPAADPPPSSPAPGGEPDAGAGPAGDPSPSATQNRSPSGANTQQ